MLNTPQAFRGMVTAPHHLAAQAGLAVLREGGNAIEAAVTTAAAIAVVYPHMNSLGGDGFWLIHQPGKAPRAIDASGWAGGAVTMALYRDQGIDAIPARGPLAANTVAGTIAGWAKALEVAAGWGRPLPLARLLADAIHYAEDGFAVTGDQAETTAAKLDQLQAQPGFADHYLVDGRAPAPGSQLKQPALAATLRRLSVAGLDDFYRGDLARSLAADLARQGSPLTAADLGGYAAATVAPLSTRLSCGKLFNLPPPTQGLASLIILALYERLAVSEAEGFYFLHGLVEATKQAFLLRDRELADPDTMTVDPAAFLTADALDAMAKAIDREQALAWPAETDAGDTVWLGVVDGNGCAISFIQSTYWEFGSGVVLPDTGIVWQNRGSSFSLDPASRRALAPGRRPFHTLNPALALFDDGRVMSYGCMGGEGQPQTQAAVFARYALHGQGLQQAVTAPRWLLGRSWGAETTTLKLESRFDSALVEQLAAAGHAVEIVAPFTPLMGHAGALIRYPDGRIEGASDPRGDGLVAAY